jgi:DNA-binding GntR family transcriptional regulator
MRLPLPEVRGGRVLADWVTRTLREAILQGHLKPGEKIDQDLVADELDVSRTPIREALRVLESEGFVDIRPHRGAYVSTVTQKDIQEIYEVRALIEAEMVRQVTPMIPDAVLDQLEQSLEEAQTEEGAGYVASDVTLHDAIAALVRNELLKEILDSLNRRIIRVRRFAQLQPGYHLQESHQEHCAIVQAMRKRDRDRAAKLMARHLRNSAQRIRELPHVAGTGPGIASSRNGGADGYGAYAALNREEE